jgi:hypothetical protein
VDGNHIARPGCYSSVARRLHPPLPIVVEHPEPIGKQMTVGGDIGLYEMSWTTVVDDLEEPLRIRLGKHASDRAREHVKPPAGSHHYEHPPPIRWRGHQRPAGRCTEIDAERLSRTPVVPEPRIDERGRTSRPGSGVCEFAPRPHRGERSQRFPKQRDVSK